MRRGEPIFGHDHDQHEHAEATGADMRSTFLAGAAAALVCGSAAAHHGWGSYDASKPITVSGTITASKYENPHASITVKAPDKVWTVTLAPTFRMTNRGATKE